MVTGFANEAPGPPGPGAVDPSIQSCLVIAFIENEKKKEKFDKLVQVEKTDVKCFRGEECVCVCVCARGGVGSAPLPATTHAVRPL